jgi:hypothetical protein
MLKVCADALGLVLLFGLAWLLIAVFHALAGL